MGERGHNAGRRLVGPRAKWERAAKRREAFTYIARGRSRAWQLTSTRHAADAQTTPPRAEPACGARAHT
eukprot:5607798-Pleurochrysis_carterae.AAC.1